jgi:GAF domain-containing protein/HAMP domain-containing protein
VKLKPVSIRRKLVLALLLAILPSFVLQIYNEFQNNARIQKLGLPIFNKPEIVALRVAATILVGTVVVFITGNRIGNLMSRLTHIADAISAGDYRRRVQICTGDELQKLGEALNALGENLMRHEATIREQSEMLAGMAEAARIASSSLELRACGKAVAKVVCTLLGARDAAVFYGNNREGGLKLIGYSGKHPRSVWKLVASRASESGEYLLIAEHNAVSANTGLADEAILVGIPLISEHITQGAIVARFQGGIPRDDLKLGSIKADVLSAFGVHAAAALANAQAYSETAKYSEILENRVQDLSLIMRVTDAISPSLTLDETLEALARETASILSVDVCAIFVPNKLGALVMRGCSAPSIAYLANKNLNHKQTETGMAFTEKRTVVCRDTSRSKFALTRRINREMGMRSLLSTPLLVEDRAIGAITVYTSEPKQFTTREIGLLASIGLHTAVIVRNASLYSRESSIAETLQSSLVSAVMKECRGLRFASRYFPASNEAMIGGDFFDVSQLPNGKVGVVIGDVSGKGLEAAIHLAACKYMMKSLMYAKPDDPAGVLTELNKTLNYYFNMSFFVTVFYGVIDPEEEVIEYANAGHVPALLITEGGKLHSILSSTGIPAGSGYDCHYGTNRVRFSPTDTLLLYTDGIIDIKTETGTLGVEGLYQLVFEIGNLPAPKLVEQICNHLSDNKYAIRNDDMAILAVSFNGIKAGQSGLDGGKCDKQYRLPTEIS